MPISTLARKFNSQITVFFLLMRTFLFALYERTEKPCAFKLTSEYEDSIENCHFKNIAHLGNNFKTIDI